MTDLALAPARGRTLPARVITVGCTVRVENTADYLYAHVELDGIEPGPGDSVTVHGAPAKVMYGEKATFRCTATVVRATWIGRLLTRIAAYLELTELYEVSFSAGRIV